MLVTRADHHRVTIDPRPLRRLSDGRIGQIAPNLDEVHPYDGIVRSPLSASRGSSVPTLRLRPGPVIMALTGGVISDWPNPALSSPGGPSPTPGNAGAANKTSTTPKLGVGPVPTGRSKQRPNARPVRTGPTR